MVVKRYAVVLAVLVGCGGSSSTVKADIFEDDFEEGDQKVQTVDTDDLTSAIDLEQTLILEYDLPYTVYIDGVEVGTGRMWRIPAAGSGDDIISGVELRITNSAGATVTLSEVHHFDARAPHRLVRAVVNGRPVDVRLPEDSNVNALALVNRVYVPDRVRRGMWHKARIYNADTNTVDVETTIVRKLGWAEIDGRQVRVLYIDHESSSRPNASTVVLSTGITAFWERDGVAMRLVGSTLDNQ